MLKSMRKSKNRYFYHIFVSPGDAPGVNSLKLVPFESLGAVSYSPSIVTMVVSVAVCKIFSVKEWCVVWMKKEFDAYKLSRCMCQSNYNHF